MKRFTRLAALAVGTLGLVGAMAPPASAVTTITTTFVGQATVTGGIGYPVVTLPTPTVPTIVCLDPLPDGNPVPNCHTEYTDVAHRRDVTVDSRVACADTSAHVAKPGKLTPHTGPCFFQGVGYVTGHCGASGGQVTGTYVDSLGQTYDFRVHFSGVGGELVITGHVTKQSTGRTGKITGEVTAVPVTTTPVLTPDGPSCTNKRQETFTLVGETTVTIDNI